MNRNIRTVMLATAFSAVVAAGFTAVTLSSGQSREMDLAETCAHAAWPMIPAGCLEGGKGHAVRYVSADAAHAEEVLRLRFAAAFD